MPRQYKIFRWKDSNFRICSTHFDTVTAEIVRQRQILEQYIEEHPDFRAALIPVGCKPKAPPIVRAMTEAAAKTGVGPMAAVAGAIAQFAAAAAIREGAVEAIVENGGDVFVHANTTVNVGLYPGTGSLAGKLALQLTPDRLPLAVCSSSSKMGHSFSFGKCDLATVVAPNATLADAAATRACNLVKSASDIESVLDRICHIQGIDGAIVIAEGKVGMKGNLPSLIANRDAELKRKVTKDPTAADPDSADR